MSLCATIPSQHFSRSTCLFKRLPLEHLFVPSVGSFQSRPAHVSNEIIIFLCPMHAQRDLVLIFCITEVRADSADFGSRVFIECHVGCVSSLNVKSLSLLHDLSQCAFSAASFVTMVTGCKESVTQGRRVSGWEASLGLRRLWQ